MKWGKRDTKSCTRGDVQDNPRALESKEDGNGENEGKWVKFDFVMNQRLGMFHLQATYINAVFVILMVSAIGLRARTRYGRTPVHLTRRFFH